MMIKVDEHYIDPSQVEAMRWRKDIKIRLWGPNEELGKTLIVYMMSGEKYYVYNQALAESFLKQVLEYKEKNAAPPQESSS